MRIAVMALLLGTVLAATPADAQFKKPKGAVGKAAGEKAVSSATGASADATTTPKTGAVSYDDRVLEITADRLDQLLLGLEAERRMAVTVEAQDLAAIDRENDGIRAAYERDQAAYEAKAERHKACANSQIGDQTKMQAVAERIQAAQKAGHTAEAQRLSDSLMKAMSILTTPGALEAKVNATCGPAPMAPERSADHGVLTYSDVRRAGQEASGLTPVQYAILRERVAPVMLADRNSGKLVYSSDELAAIDARSADLAAYADILKR